MLFASMTVAADIIQSSNTFPAVPGVTVGVRGPLPIRTNLINITDAPYNADPTGVADSSQAIIDAASAVASNGVIYIPTGRYRMGQFVQIDKSYFTLRGDGPTNSLLMGLTNTAMVLKIGHDNLYGSSLYSVASGATKGATNMVLADGTDMNAGDIYWLTMDSPTNFTGSGFVALSTSYYERIINQPILILSRSGNNITFTPPLVSDFWLNPRLEHQGAARRMVGIEGIGITLTNTVTGESATTATGFEIYLASLADFWVTNCSFTYANNYQLGVASVVHGHITHNTIATPLTGGTSHAGILAAYASGCLIEDNILWDRLGPAIEYNTGFSGNAIVGNFFTNNFVDIDCHNAHPWFNIIEGNKCAASIKEDGYFGSSSHSIMLRNAIGGTLWLDQYSQYFFGEALKINRFVTFEQVVGNVFGNNLTNWLETTDVNGNSLPVAMLLNYPHIGNAGYEGTSGPIPWNFPGHSFVGPASWQGLSYPVLPNGIWQATNTVGPTNTLWGNFTNIPPLLYPLVFQDGNNTNFYYSFTANGVSVSSPLGGTTTNIVLNKEVYVTNGSRLYVVGADNFNQRQLSNVLTHTIHGNTFYGTNGVTYQKWDSSIASQDVPASIVYASGAPGWWGTNRWPAIQPDSALLTTTIPAEDRFNGMESGGEPEEVEGDPMTGTRTITKRGATRQSGAVRIQ